MIESQIAPHSPATSVAAGLKPLRPEAWRRIAPQALALAMLLASLWQLRAISPHEIIAMMPANPVFWLLFAAGYLALPLSEWLIFARLWGIPPAALVILLRKRVSNEILFSYSGEIFFYSWARRHVAMAAAPFGAIKDTAILSAAAGNVITLILVIVAWPLLRALNMGFAGHALVLSVVVLMAISLAMFGLRHSLFSLAPAELRFVGLVHIARIIVTTLLTAALWHSVLPAAPLTWWAGLSTLRLLVWRMPFVPTKDIVFAGLVSLLIGHGTATAGMLTMIAGLMLVANLTLGATLGLSELFKAAGPWR